MESYLRRPAAEDWEKWASLWRQYLHFYRTDLPFSATRQLWQRLLDPQNPIQGWVVSQQGEAGILKGFVHYLPHANTWRSQPVCYLQDLYVAPETRGTGLGRRLIEQVVTDARARGWSRVYWHTESGNTTARRLYDRVAGPADGFVKYALDV
ncbi:GNAT family N-acetyltransferase [Pseudomaricurvus alkylphenolicus]|uniref:GNAT family N-acetyltransferase n=1 Tax=Pseudomaricurvus alkylphenolicus TaxID=1306991 RepID=UPI0019806F4B